jgi:hemoglobin
MMNKLSEDTRKTEGQNSQKIPQTPYALLGGEAGVRQLVDRFYDIMDEAPEAVTIRAMHGPDLAPIRARLFEYLSGWLGGPPLYAQRTGSVCITAAHKPFAIGPAERDQWLLCMRRALDDVGASEEVKQMLENPLAGITDFLRNR